MQRQRPRRLFYASAVLALTLAACGGADETEPTATDTEPLGATETITEPLGGTDTETEPLGGTDTETEPLGGTETEPLGGTETEPLGDPGTETEIGGAAGVEQDILGMAAGNPEFSMLTQAIEAAGLQDALSDVGPITVFAPTDEAFSSVDQSMLTELMADPTQLGDILQYHIVEGEVLPADLTDGATLDTLAGETLDVSVDGGTTMVGDATVTGEPVQASNGVIYGIDQVLMPAGA